MKTKDVNNSSICICRNY